MDAIAEKYNATVVGRQSLTEDLFILKVKPDRVLEPFTSGQYVLLGLSSNLPRRSDCEPEFKESKPDRLVLRAYSIASAGYETEVLEFYISLVSNGALTPRLVNLRVGDRLNLGDKIRGVFTLDTVPMHHRTVILAATGTGIAPYVSMLRQHLLKPFPFRILILQGAPHSWEMGYHRELMLYAQLLPNVTYVPTITRVKIDPWWNGETGRITRFFEHNLLRDRFQVELDPNSTSVFLCGNPAMIHEVTALLAKRGYALHTKDAPGSLHTEEYW